MIFINLYKCVIARNQLKLIDNTYFKKSRRKRELITIHKSLNKHCKLRQINKLITCQLSYFNTTYQQNQFSDSLTQDDIQQIAIEFEKYKTKSLTKIEITKLIIDTVFKTRDLFFRNVYKQVVSLISKQQKLKGKKPQLKKEKGTCSLCNKPNVYIFCLQCNLFFCQLCKVQHIDDSMHFEFK
ncbi:FYVE/PHD-type [Hexamita inflata]|uniref:FYVE/PHD-type n=1 Tax=Hexamita inflata TaxID=28002 RepID=A0AA86NT40_9EUKA|nr:FYVE/PHD-type [Hexamita inflata]